MTRASFEAFWASYPRKVGKLAAQRAWKARHVTPEIDDLITAALAWQVPAWAAAGTRFIPNPATWLNQGRWLDEPSAPEANRPDIPDTRGHVPPCRTNSECIEKFARDIDERRRRTSET